ncbi:MAG: hypothetical protein U0990_11315 [Candidatus Nanopelagicales bacterium]|nr:hypothetical protein [Candidatus Nanopelagicales bacterium]MDZ4250657.1 hypothetical protein [Candidatus Nanopelagicales bacterium]
MPAPSRTSRAFRPEDSPDRGIQLGISYGGPDDDGVFGFHPLRALTRVVLVATVALVATAFLISGTGPGHPGAAEVSQRFVRTGATLWSWALTVEELASSAAETVSDLTSWNQAS